MKTNSDDNQEIPTRATKSQQVTKAEKGNKETTRDEGIVERNKG